MNDLQLVTCFSDGTPMSREDMRVAEQRGLIADRGNGYILTNKGSDLLLGSKPVEPMEVSFEEPVNVGSVKLEAFPSLDIGQALDANARAGEILSEYATASGLLEPKTAQDNKNYAARILLDYMELAKLAEYIKPEPSALDVQVGGGHYKDMKIQPVEFITANNLGFLAGCVIKRICRYKAKNGIEDLEKAKHEIDLLIELELKNGN